MALNRYKLGELIELCDERNSDNLNLPFFGINREKEFMPTVADTTTLDSRKYKIVKNNRFVFSGMQTGRDQCIRIGMYNGNNEIVVSPAYSTFEVTSNKILPLFLFMIFNSNEKDRYGAFLSDGSIRSNLDWKVFCDIELNLPSIEIQQKYVNIYKGMLENQRAYETGLEDLKLVCDATIEDLRRKYPCEKIGKYIHQTDRLNTDKNSKIMGISNLQKFSPSNSRVDGADVLKYGIVEPREFGYSPIHINEGSIALNLSNETYAISPIYRSFVSDEKLLLSEYLMLYFSRSEFIRYCWYNAYGSARDNLSWEDLCEYSISVPSIEIQKDIVDIFNVYNERKQINETLKKQIKDICPILIKGAMEEGNYGTKRKIIFKKIFQNYRRRTTN